MKKIICYILTFILCILLCSCEGNTPDGNSVNPNASKGEENNSKTDESNDVSDITDNTSEKSEVSEDIFIPKILIDANPTLEFCLNWEHKFTEGYETAYYSSQDIDHSLCGTRRTVEIYGETFIGEYNCTYGCDVLKGKYLEYEIIDESGALNYFDINVYNNKCERFTVDTHVYEEPVDIEKAEEMAYEFIKDFCSHVDIENYKTRNKECWGEYGAYYYQFIFAKYVNGIITDEFLINMDKFGNIGFFKKSSYIDPADALNIDDETYIAGCKATIENWLNSEDGCDCTVSVSNYAIEEKRGEYHTESGLPMVRLTVTMDIELKTGETLQGRRFWMFYIPEE